ncbi:uncharacterized protein OCT59_001419 [Rhizophagus irregularis]|uniref:F-box domain-containing protein n=4 Tax=Rhizophagus irregularis TaxID=588596 RepID=A0A015KIV0_RHIIW|nr:hypothetical protein RirG_113760 [Rhizophagus irregularis DAOM 197198w]UZO00165.1 hypothetical protein OCT59_001419 [Rhizophagus irregularis]
MACQLPADCLNEIFEYLEIDKFTLHSCLLVNRLWCEISVRILWRNPFDFKFDRKRSFKIYSSILSTLIACLPDESKNFLYNNGIFILTPTSKPLLFNYASFFKALSIYRINTMIVNVLKNRPYSISVDKNSLVANEIIKMFANQISSLKKLTYYHSYFYYKRHFNISFPHFPGARDLSELCCGSDLPSDFFYQLSQICHNLQSISIDFRSSVTDELKGLISSQNNLKDLNLSAFDDGSWTDIIPAITKHSHTITKLKFHSDDDISSFSFISSFSNLQELLFSFLGGVLEDFIKLQYVNFLKLQVLKIPYECPKPEYVMKFLENNGKNLKKFYTGENNKDLSLSIAKFCPNLKSLFVIFNDDEIDVLKTILINCQYLESIKIWCGTDYLSEKEVLETVAKYSPNNFCELKIHHITNSDVSPDDLESFFICWERRTLKKLSFTIIVEYQLYCGYNNLETLEVIKKYENLGTIKYVTKSEEEESEEEEEKF